MVEAPGWPGIPPRWTSSAKDGIGTALSEGSRVWFTISHGIVNEIYYPRVDQACVRDLGLIVTDGDAFFAEVKRDCDIVVERIEDGVPAFRLTSTHRGGRFRLVNQVVADPRSDSIVLHIGLEDASKTGLRVFSLLAPHARAVSRRRKADRADRGVRIIPDRLRTSFGAPDFVEYRPWQRRQLDNGWQRTIGRYDDLALRVVPGNDTTNCRRGRLVLHDRRAPVLLGASIIGTCGACTFENRANATAAMTTAATPRLP